MITINEIELATKLAHNQILADYKMLDYPFKEKDMYVDANAEMLVYTDVVQKAFNEYYDYYLNEIENCKIIPQIYLHK